MKKYRIRIKRDGLYYLEERFLLIFWLQVNEASTGFVTYKEARNKLLAVMHNRAEARIVEYI